VHQESKLGMSPSVEKRGPQVICKKSIVMMLTLALSGLFVFPRLGFGENQPFLNELAPETLFVPADFDLKTLVKNILSRARGVKKGVVTQDVKVNADDPFHPASTVKMVTAIRALQELGPDFRFSTDLLARTVVVKDPVGSPKALYALTLRMTGDPSFGSRLSAIDSAIDSNATEPVSDSTDADMNSEEEFVEDPSAQSESKAAETDLLKIVDALIDPLFADGVRPMVLDEIAIEKPVGLQNSQQPPGWIPSDWRSHHGVTPSGITIDWGAPEIMVTAGKGRVSVRWKNFDSGSMPPLYSQVSVGRKGSRSRNRVVIRKGRDGYIISGRLSAGKSRSIRILHFDGENWLRTLICLRIAQRGGQLFNGTVNNMSRGGNRRGGESVLLSSHFSEPLPLILKDFLKHSRNVTGEVLVRSMATQALTERGTPPSSVSEVHVEVARQQTAAVANFAPAASLQNIYLTDGSGLSRLNRLTPQALYGYLESLPQTLDFKMFYIFQKSLAVLGQDGTLGRRGAFSGAKQTGLVVAKTGTMSRSSNLAGFAGGRPFVIFNSCERGCNLRVAKSLQDDLASVFKNYVPKGLAARNGATRSKRRVAAQPTKPKTTLARVRQGP
jgi:PBP4 family serine-type D-alanyl-D-alanine carboxypeptidase